MMAKTKYGRTSTRRQPFPHFAPSEATLNHFPTHHAIFVMYCVIGEASWFITAPDAQSVVVLAVSVVACAFFSQSVGHLTPRLRFFSLAFWVKLLLYSNRLWRLFGKENSFEIEWWPLKLDET